MNIMRTTFEIGIAGLVVKINTVSTCTCVLCRNYLLQSEVSKPDIQIEVTEKDIENEFLEDLRAHHNRVSAETIAAYRKIAEQTPKFDAFVMHGAVIGVDGYAYMFTAPSGTGKTTHIYKWLKKVRGSYVINGDKPLIRVFEQKVIACGTPWSGTEHMDTNTILPLHSIVLMQRGEENSIEEISFVQAYPSLLRQTYLPNNIDMAKKTLAHLYQLNGKVKLYRFQCNNFKEDCFDVAYNALVKNEGINT